MIYYGFGEGNLIERNKNRITYVNNLSNNAITLEKYIDKTFKSLEDQNIKTIIKQLKSLFYEEICTQCINNMIEIYTKLNSNQIEKLKLSIINNYKCRPDKGFIWNMYHQFNILNKKLR